MSLEVLKALPQLQEREQPRGGRFGSGGRGGFGDRSGGRFSGRRNDRFGSSGGRGRGGNGRRW